MGSRRWNLIARHKARRRHWVLADEYRQAQSNFMDDDPDIRHDALMEMAECEDLMAGMQWSLVGANDQDADGFTREQSHRSSALLLAMVADTEAYPWYPMRRSDLDDDPALFDVLTALSVAPNPYQKAELTLALYDLVVGRVGGQAAEVLTTSVAYCYFRLSGMDDQEARWRTGPHAPTRGS